MLLAVDVGNTNVVFAVIEGGTARQQWRAVTHASRTGDEYAAWLSQLMGIDGLAFTDITDAIISTVVPQALFDLRAMCRKYFQCEPIIIGENAEIGIDVRLERPADAGADRLVNAVGAFQKYGGPLIIVDFGTATTFDIIDPDGAFAGGVIASGINLSLEALHMASAQLPRIAVARCDRVIGTGTVSAMQSGVYWGYVGLVEGLVERIKQEYGAPMKVIGTGGLAVLFAEGTDALDEIDQDLTILGLMEIHRRTKTAEGVGTG